MKYDTICFQFEYVIAYAKPMRFLKIGITSKTEVYQIH